MKTKHHQYFGHSSTRKNLSHKIKFTNAQYKSKTQKKTTLGQTIIGIFLSNYKIKIKRKTQNQKRAISI